MPADRSALICVAALAGAFGVRGEARVKSFTAEPEAFADYGPLTDENGSRVFGVKIVRPIPGGFAARLTGVDTREQAEAMKGLKLYAPRARLPALPDDEFYHADLLGLSVFDPGGAPLGRVIAVQNYGAGDFLEIGGHGFQPLMLPFTQACVPTVDLASGRIVADPPDEIIVQDFGEQGDDGGGEDGRDG